MREHILQPNGLTIEFYKKCKVILSVNLHKLFLACLKETSLPPPWGLAKAILLPKQDRNLQLPESYRPLLLLNVDYKILTTILAAQLNKILAIYVHRDQADFVKGRKSKDNIRNLCNTVSHTALPATATSALTK